MGDFNLIPGRTDTTGRIGTPPNLIAPGKRMLSSQSPTIVLKDGKVRLVTGSPGGRTIPNTTLWVVLNVLEFGMTPSEAVAAPRTHHQWFPDVLSLEGSTWPAETREALVKMGHKVRTVGSQGDAHSIVVDPDGTIHGAPGSPAEDVEGGGGLNKGGRGGGSVIPRSSTILREEIDRDPEGVTDLEGTFDGLSFGRGTGGVLLGVTPDAGQPIGSDQASLDRPPSERAARGLVGLQGHAANLAEVVGPGLVAREGLARDVDWRRDVAVFAGAGAGVKLRVEEAPGAEAKPDRPARRLEILDGLPLGRRGRLESVEIDQGVDEPRHPDPRLLVQPPLDQPIEGFDRTHLG